MLLLAIEQKVQMVLLLNKARILITVSVIIRCASVKFSIHKISNQSLRKRPLEKVNKQKLTTCQTHPK